MCPALMTQENLDPWINFFIAILNRPMPAELTTPTNNHEDITERDKHPLWKMKGMAAHILFRVFSKYGNARFVEEADKPFNEMFNSRYAIPALEAILTCFFARTSQFIGSKCLSYSIKFVQQSSKIDLTM